MEKIVTFISLISCFLLAGCGSSESNESSVSSEITSTSSSEEETSSLNEFELDYEYFKESYGDFSLTQSGTEIEGVDGVYTINVAESKLEYVATGYLEGRIIIANGDNLSSYKGVTLYLSNAFIVSDDQIAIDYNLNDKNIEIISAKNTTNYVVNTSATNYDGHALNSMNNLELSLKADSVLNLYTKHGHTIKADGDVKLIGSGNIYMSSGHDGIHCHNFTTVNSGTFTGAFTMNNAISQGIEASLSDGSGTVNITNGTFIINNCESVLKVDATINITGGSLTATGIWSDPFVRGGKTVLTLNISEGVTVIVNGENYTSQEI